VGKPISLFSGYAQRENRTTNYCLLVLKMLYEENPRYLGEVFGALIGEDVVDHVGITFRQQERKALSVPDGLIIQKPITIFLETKNFDWFYDEQLENHLSELDKSAVGLKVLIALGQFESAEGARFSRIESLCKDKYLGAVSFAAITFEDFIAALQLLHLPKSLADSVSELRAYFDEEGLLPSWREWLDVVNCAGVPEDVLQGNVYLCPTTGGSYSHDRCAFFGMYRNKRVEVVADILAVVDVQADSTATLKWKNAQDDTSKLTAQAVQVALARRPNDLPVRVFLLGKLFETDFLKDSPGGMWVSKQYFNVAQLGMKTAEKLAPALRGKHWSELQVRGK